MRLYTSIEWLREHRKPLAAWICATLLAIIFFVSALPKKRLSPTGCLKKQDAVTQENSPASRVELPSIAL